MTILNWLKTLRVKMQAKKAARATINELSALTNAELNDIIEELSNTKEEECESCSI